MYVELSSNGEGGDVIGIVILVARDPFEFRAGWEPLYLDEESMKDVVV